jgi:thymidylate synthase (FAD)
VQSQRYVTLSQFEYVTPPEIEKVPQALALFKEAMEDCAKKYREISGILKDKHREKLISEGTSVEKADSMAEKLSIEDARFVLPNACDTKMVVTMNARSLYNFFNKRCCSRAQWEIRSVADKMLLLVKEVAPVIFENAGPPCLSGPCPEGKMSCGQAASMRKKYKGIVE